MRAERKLLEKSNQLVNHMKTRGLGFGLSRGGLAMIAMRDDFTSSSSILLPALSHLLPVALIRHTRTSRAVIQNACNVVAFCDVPHHRT